MNIKIKLRMKLEHNPKLLRFYEELSFYKAKILSFIPDEIYVRWLFKNKTGNKINLDNPITLSDKVNWLKINNKNPKLTTLTNKVTVREHIRSLGLQNYLVPIEGVYKDVNSIPFERLNDDWYFIKTNHDSGTVVRFKYDAKKNSIEKIKKNLNKKLKRNYYIFSREWNYKNIDPAIIIEKNIKNKEELIEYKIFCFNSHPEFIFIYEDTLNENGEKKTNPSKVIVDREFNLLEMQMGKKSDYGFYSNLIKPDFWEKMLKDAERISKDLPFVRVDFLFNGKKLFFGETTFNSGGGNFTIKPEKYNIELGNKLDISNLIKNKHQ